MSLIARSFHETAGNPVLTTIPIW